MLPMRHNVDRRDDRGLWRARISLPALVVASTIKKMGEREGKTDLGSGPAGSKALTADQALSAIGASTSSEHRQAQHWQTGSSSSESRQLLEHLDDGALVIADQNVLFANQSLLQMLAGAPAPEGTANKAPTRLPRGVREFFEQFVQHTEPMTNLDLVDYCLRFTERGSLEDLELRQANGGVLPIKLCYSTLAFERQQARLLVITSRLAEQRLKERLRRQERLALTGQLASGVAHAINNPLAYVTTNIAYCKERLDYIEALLLGENSVQIEDPRLLRGLLLPITEALAEANQGTSRVGHLARNLSTLSETGRPNAMVDIKEVVMASSMMCEGVYRHRARLQTEFSLSGRVRTSIARLTQIIANLIVTAAASFAENSPSKNLIKLRIHGRGHDVFIDVEDNGPGLSPTTITQVERADLHTWAADDGPVLWLLSAKRLAEAIGGDLSLRSNSGQTTRVRVVLPDSWEQAAPSRVGRPSLPMTRKARVLLVDNEPLILRALSRFLNRDYDVECAENGHEALQVIFDGTPPDLILCDLLMPEMSGMELFETVKAESPDLLSRFAFLTGGAFTEETAAFLRNSERPTLSKPLDPLTLRAAVRELLDTEVT